ATEWIRTHPRRFAELAVQKFAILWGASKDIPWWALEHPVMERKRLGVPWRFRFLSMAYATGFYAACSLFAAVGLWTRRRMLRGDSAWIVLVAIILYFTAVHMVFESQGKYHFMMLPLLCIFAALPAETAEAPPVTLPIPLGETKR
ncbi:MAG TPA: hypothetical protein VMZ50_02410, partial [Phycisphaerae bacterium]|nr:hypothetical protein [Phycisphaerae bacterium]